MFWMWSVWVGLGSVGWGLGHQWQKSMTDIYQINILATFKLEQICKISLKWLHFKTQSGNYHIGRIHVKHYWNQYSNITDTNIKIQLLVFNIWVYISSIYWLGCEIKSAKSLNHLIWKKEVLLCDFTFYRQILIF